MSINSLANFGTPGLNGDRGPSIQPILGTHWRMTTFGFGDPREVAPYDITRMAQAFTLPSLTFETATIYNYVSIAYIPTRGEWSEGSFVLRDDITNLARGRLEDQVNKQKNFFDQTMSRAGQNTKFNIDLDVLAGGATAGASAADPNVIRKYCYSGCFITGFDDGEMNYETATPKTINVRFRYDNVIVFNHNNVRMGNFSHTEEIQAQAGSLTTGVGPAGGTGVSLGGASINAGFSGVSLGGATVSGNIGTGGNSFGLNF